MSKFICIECKKEFETLEQAHLHTNPPTSKVKVKRHLIFPKTAGIIAVLLCVAGAMHAQGMTAQVVRDAGYCPDVLSPACDVRDFYPRELRTTAMGSEAYWFSNSQRQVCFVSRTMYAKWGIGQIATCIWRDRRP